MRNTATLRYHIDTQLWSEYLHIMSIQGALQAYEKASQILTDSVGADIPPEILNNIGALYHKLDNLEEAKVRQEG